MNTKLKPCPFCSGPAAFSHNSDGGNWIECTQCGSGTNLRYSLMDDCKPLLAEQWNRRAAQPVSAGLTDDAIVALAKKHYGTLASTQELAFARAQLSAAQRDSGTCNHGLQVQRDSQPGTIMDSLTVRFAGDSQPGTAADARDAALAEVHKFLLGEGPLDGLWYGDVKPDAPTKRYWWRTPLRAAIAASREGK